ncbi:MAG: TIGR02253 family HAD-type hydrolase [Candidatus Woesearchaeota archaeon]
MIKAVLFDLDNTLIDFMRMKKECCDAAISAMISAGLNIEKKKGLKTLFDLYDKYGIEYSQIFQEFLKKVNRKIDYKILANGIYAYRKVQVGLIEPYPGVVPTLIKLREKGLKLAIVTDAPTLKAWLRLVEMRLDSFFDVVVCFEDTGKHKPHKKPFALAIKKLKVKPTEAVFIGDWPERDIVGARSLGIKTVFAKYGYSMNKNPSATADFIIERFEDILKILKEIEERSIK